MQKFCSKCGTQLEEGIRFCPNCGTPLQEPQTFQKIEEPQIIPQQKKNIKISPKLIGIIAGIVVAIVVLVIALSSGGNSKERVLRSYLDAIAKGDVDAAYSLLSKAQKEILGGDEKFYERFVDDFVDFREYLIDECGEHISYTISDIEIDDADSDEIKELNEELKKEGCSVKISAISEIDGNVEFVGDEGTYHSSIYIELCKEGSTWRVVGNY